MAEFNVNLNPQNTGTSLTDMLKTEDYIERNRAYKNAAWLDKNMKPGKTMTFKAGAGYQQPTGSLSQDPDLAD